MSKAYVSIGSNVGDRAGNLLLGVRGMLEAGLNVARLSAIYETEPVDYLNQPEFLNMVAELAGNDLPTPEQTLARLLRVEYALGRTRDVSKGPRSIDLDLLLYDDVRRDSEFLRLPHPRLHERRFVLVPLTELAPTLVHPVLRKSIAELLSVCSDRNVSVGFLSSAEVSVALWSAVVRRRTLECGGKRQRDTALDFFEGRVSAAD